MSFLSFNFPFSPPLSFEFVVPSNYEEPCPEDNVGIVDCENEFNLGNYRDEVPKDLVLTVRDVDRLLRDRDMLLECRNRDFYSVYCELVEANKRNEEREKLRGRKGRMD